MPEPDKDNPKKPDAKPAPRGRSVKPGAAPDQESADPIRDEAERLKSSSSADRNKRTHKQSGKRDKD